MRNNRSQIKNILLDTTLRGAERGKKNISSNFAPRDFFNTILLCVAQSAQFFQYYLPYLTSRRAKRATSLIPSNLTPPTARARVQFAENVFFVTPYPEYDYPLTWIKGLKTC